MQTISIKFFDTNLNLRYTIHSPNYVEWALNTVKPASQKQVQLIEILLRLHYAYYIESTIKEHDFYQAYAENESLIAKDDLDVPF